MSVISTEQLSRNYGRRIGVSEVNLEIGAGEIFGFLGPNGAGKSTTIRLLLGFLKPDSGRASIFGKDCWDHSADIKRDLGYLPGDLRLYSWFTARRALKVVGKIRNMDLMPAGNELAERFQLEMDVPVRRMSRGNRQKVGIVLALAHRPKLIVLDEPTSGLDPLMQLELARQLRELASAGHTVFFSSHTLSEVESLCQRVAIVRRGQIVADQSLESMRKRAHRKVGLSFDSESSAGAIDFPSFLQVLSRDGVHCECELLGATTELVRWAATQPLADISISPPDLESVFHQYYQTSEVN